jgi:hypothetical protein
VRQLCNNDKALQQPIMSCNKGQPAAVMWQTRYSNHRASILTLSHTSSQWMQQRQLRHARNSHAPTVGFCVTENQPRACMFPLSTSAYTAYVQEELLLQR